MRTIAVFDFDGTITQKDTLLEFIKYVKGNTAFYFGFLLYSPYLFAYKLGLYSNWKVKQKIFAHFFKGMKYDSFKVCGIGFIKKIETFIYPEQLKKIQWHKARNHDVYVISASIEEWVAPWCQDNGIAIHNVLCTKIEVDNKGFLTGNFLSKNCYGKEKVNRFLKREPNRSTYYLYAYGDSRGDREMLAFADQGVYVGK